MADTPPFSEGPHTEETVDAAYNQYLRNLHPAQRDPDLPPQVVKNPDLAKILQSKDVMSDVLDSFLNRSNAPQSRDVKIPLSKERGELYRWLSLDYDSASTRAELISDRSWYKEHGLLAPPMTYEEFLKKRFGKELVDIMAPDVGDEPLLPPMDNIVDLSKVKEDISLENTHKDLIQKIDFNVADQVEKSLQHPWLYEVGDRVISHDGAERGLPPLRITGRVVRSKGLLEGSEPHQGLFLRGPDVPYYTVERDDPFEGGTETTSIPEWAVKQKFGVRGEVADPSVLEKGIMAADIGSKVADEIRSLKKPPPGKPPSNLPVPVKPDPLRRGIGGLKGAPYIALVQMGWDSLNPKQKQKAKDYAVEAYGSFENAWEAALAWKRRNVLAKPGLEYFKEALGLAPQEPKGIMSLPPMLQSGEYASDTVEGRVPVYHGTPSPEITGGRFDVEGHSLVEDPLGQGAAAKGTGQYSAQGLGVAEDYFDKEPRGRVLLNNKLLPKSHSIPTMTELTTEKVMGLERERAEKFAKDFGVDVEDVNIISGILEQLEGEKYSYGDTDRNLESIVEVTRSDVSSLRILARENRKFLEGYSSMSDEDFAILHGTSSLETMKDNIDYFRRKAEDLERRVEDNTRLLEVVDKYNLKGTPGALVEFAYHPDDWKNMIDLDMKLSDQPEILEKVLQMPSVKRLLEDDLMPGYIRQLSGQDLSADLLYEIEGGTNSVRQAKILLAREFAEAGIPGNKFFDQQSRLAMPPRDTSKPTSIKLNSNKMTDYLRIIGKPMGLTGLGDNTPLRVMENVEKIILETKGLPEALDMAKSLMEGALDVVTIFKEVGDAEISLIETMIEKGVKLDLEYPEPKEDTRTKNAVVWDQKAMDRATRPVVLEGGRPPRKKAEGGLVDKPLYEQPRMVG